MTPEIWTTLLILNKFLMYLGVAGAIGGSLSMFLFTSKDVSLERRDVIEQWQHRICKYGLLFISIGFVANLADFFVQTGNMSETGISGMLEPIMLEMLWVSSVGTITVIRSVFLALSALMIVSILMSPLPLKSASKRAVYGLLAAIITLGLSYSFTLSGHTNDLAFGSVMLIILHVSIAFAWLGSLLPLLFATWLFSDKELYSLMTRFGHYAAWLVTLLLVAGTGMLIQLISSFDDLFSTAYGWLFIGKIALVLCILVFAAWHKFHLVPKLLQQEKGHIALRRSIMEESAVGLLVLITTSVVTTAVGPSF